MSRGKLFLEEIDERVLVGDGAIGTALFSRGAEPEQGLERLNLLAPEKVLRLHRDYAAAGSRVLETNTFNANRLHLAGCGAEKELRLIIQAGVDLARQAAGAQAYVAGSVGPLPLMDGEPLDSAGRDELYSEQVALLLECGVDLLMFESFTVLDDLLGALGAARRLGSIPIVAQMAFEADGYAPDGSSAVEAAAACLEAGANIVGANCGYGVPSIMAAVRAMQPLGAPMSAFMNAGFPSRLEGRQFYLSTPDYLAGRARELAALGARLVGGCCGTDPETIRAISRVLAHTGVGMKAMLTTVTAARPPMDTEERPAPSILSVSFPVLVELDPPPHADVGPVLTSARALAGAGATALTIADNPLSSARLDAVTMAGLVQEKTGLPAVPHITGRDRNRLALQSSLMAAHALGIRALVGVTGDPVRLCSEPNTSGVFDLTSIGLVRLMAEFNSGRHMDGRHRTSFSIGVGVNPNVRSLDGQIGKLKRKQEAGAHFALTQPVFSLERLEAFQEALDKADVDIPVLIGVMPLFSSRNAEFLHNEVPGMLIPEALRARLAAYAEPVDQRKAALEAALELLSLFRSRVRGLYIITPRNHLEMVLPLLKACQTE